MPEQAPPPTKLERQSNNIPEPPPKLERQSTYIPEPPKLSFEDMRRIRLKQRMDNRTQNHMSLFSNAI